MASWDESNPEDGDIVSQYPANERAAREAVKDNFDVDHHATDDSDVGKHEVIQIVDNAGDATIDAGDVGIWNDGGVLKSRAGANSAKEVGYRGELSAPAGTKMVFYQASAPTGWTQNTAVNDRVLRVVDGAGGGTGGSWTISGVTVDHHILDATEMPVHDHGGLVSFESPTTNTAGGHNHSGSGTSSVSNHTHILDNTVTTNSGSSSGIVFAENRLGRTDFVTTAAGGHSHSLSINSDGSHSHSVTSHSHTIQAVGGGAGHDHDLTADGTWRPSHIDVIVAEKD